MTPFWFCTIFAWLWHMAGKLLPFESIRKEARFWHIIFLIGAVVSLVFEIGLHSYFENKQEKESPAKCADSIYKPPV